MALASWLVVAVLACIGSVVVSASSADAVTVTLSAAYDVPKLLHHGQLVVTWDITSGTFDPVNDFVSVWWDPFPDTYVQYHNISAQKGTYAFPVINARHGYNVRYYRGDTLVSRIGSFPVEGSYPMGVRIVLVPHDPTALQMIWTSNRSSGKEGVVYGLTPHSLVNVSIDAQTITYTADEINAKLGLPPIARRTTAFANISARALRCTYGTCYNDFTANQLFVDPGFFHIVTLTGLPAGARLYFSLGELDGYMTEPRLFATRVAAGDRDIQILYLADAGVSRDDGEFRGSASHNDCPIGNNHLDGAAYVYDAIRKDPQSFSDDIAIMNGDVSYARGWPWMWEIYHNETEDIFGRVPVMVQYGNHEFDYSNSPYPYVNGEDAGGEAGIATGKRYNFASEDEPWYWVAIGPISYFSLSSEHDITEQAVWLQSQLPRVNRQITPWIVVALHRPIHMSSKWFTAPWLDMVEALWTPLFERYGVDLVLTGHEHYYERLCAISNGKCATKARRDVWSFYPHTRINPSEACATPFMQVTVKTDDDCRQACLNQSSCTGVTLDLPYESTAPPAGANAKSHKKSSITCKLLNCSKPFDVVGDKQIQTWSVEHKFGRPPVYVVDGTAGGVFTDTSTPFSPLTVYKDFERWGYSRIVANHTALTWIHYHVDGSVVDTFSLTPVNAQDSLHTV